MLYTKLCAHCNGTGRVRTLFVWSAVCNTCDGTGRIIPQVCGPPPPVLAPEDAVRLGVGYTHDDHAH